MKKTPFNLERALAGDPVVTGDDKPVSEIYLLSTADRAKVIYPVITVVDGEMESYTEEGFYFAEKTIDTRNLFMKQETDIDLTFDEIESCFPDGYDCDDNLGGAVVSAQWLHDFAHRIERTLKEKYTEAVYLGERE